jgi:hypothetical protein
MGKLAASHSKETLAKSKRISMATAWRGVYQNASVAYRQRRRHQRRRRRQHRRYRKKKRAANGERRNGVMAVISAA